MEYFEISIFLVLNFLCVCASLIIFWLILKIRKIEFFLDVFVVHHFTRKNYF